MNDLGEHFDQVQFQDKIEAMMEAFTEMIEGFEKQGVGVRPQIITVTIPEGENLMQKVQSVHYNFFPLSAAQKIEAMKRHAEREQATIHRLKSKNLNPPNEQ